MCQHITITSEMHSIVGASVSKFRHVHGVYEKARELEMNLTYATVATTNIATCSTHQS